ncbi:MAG: hypothetical protein RSD09_03540 [Bacilli bacterium]
MDSIAGKINTLKENLKALVTGNVSSDMFKGMLEGANNLVLGIDKITSKLGALGSLGALAGITSFIKNMSNFSKFQGLSDNSLMFGKGLTSLTKNVSTATSMLGKGVGLATIGSEMGSLARSTGLAQTAMLAFRSVLTGLGIGLLLTGLSMGAKAWDDYAHATEKAVESSKENQDGIRDELTNLSGKRSSLSSLANEYDKLASKSNKSYEEIERFNELKKEIASIDPDLVKGYDANGNPILKMNDSMNQYISTLDKAIAKQERLFAMENKKISDAYEKDNKKNSDYSKNRDDYLNNPETRDDYYREKWVKGWGKSAKDVAKQRRKDLEKMNKDEQHDIETMSEWKAKNVEKDLAIQQTYTDKFLKKSKLDDGKKNAFSGFMESLNWGELDSIETGKMEKGMEKLSQVTKFTTKEMGNDVFKATKKIKEQFSDTGDLTKYGKSLAKIGSDTGKFDLQAWQDYFGETVTQFEEGSLSAKEYDSALKPMAKTMSKLSGIPESLLLNSLKDTGDIDLALASATDGLNGFMKAYGKTMADVRNGDAEALKLKEQFESISLFGTGLFDRVEQGTVTVEWMLESSNDETLPDQMQNMLKLFAGDGKATEVEQKVLMAIETEIEDEGKLSKDTITKIENLMDDDFKVTKGMKINGLDLTLEETKELQKGLADCGFEAGDIDLTKTGVEELLNSSKEVKSAIEGIKGSELRFKFLEQGFETKEQVDNMKTALDSIPKEKQVDFVGDTSKYFKEHDTVEASIEAMPDHLKLKYDIGVEGNDELTRLQGMYEKLPKSIRTKVDADVVGTENIELAYNMVQKFGSENASALLEIEGIDDILSNCSTVEEVLNTLNGKIATGEIKFEDDNAQAIIDFITQELDKLDGTETTSNHTATSEDDDLDGTKEKHGELDGTESTSKNTVESDTTELDEGSKKQDAQDGRKTESDHTIKSDTTELEEGGKKQDKENGKDTENKHTTKMEVTGQEEVNGAKKEKAELESDGHSTTTMEVNGQEELNGAKKEKSELSTDEQSTTTMNVTGQEELNQAKKEKAELSKGGQSTTNVDVNGTEKLDEANKKTKDLKDKDVKIDISFNMNEAIDSILSRLGLNKRQEEISITINCTDNVTKVLDKIKGYNDKDISVNIDAKGGKEAEQQIKVISKAKSNSVTLKIHSKGGKEARKDAEAVSKAKSNSITLKINAQGSKGARRDIEVISKAKISNKNFSIKCNGGKAVLSTLRNIKSTKITSKEFTVKANTSAVNSQLSAIANKSLPSKEFTITCNSGTALTTLSTLAYRTVPNKEFTINCNSDSATSKMNSIISKTIPNKEFKITCDGDGAITTLDSIRNKISGISGKTVTITAKYTTQGTKPAGLVGSLSNQTPQVQSSNSEAGVMSATPQATSSSEVSTMASKPKKTSPISYSQTLDAIKYSIDLLENAKNRAEKLGEEFDRLGARIERAFGSNKSKLIKQQISLLEQEQAQIKYTYERLQSQANNLKKSLGKKGFKFTSTGAIDNYNSKIIAMEKNVEKLKKKEEAYKGKNEKTKDKLSKAYEKANEELQLTKDTLSEYYDLSFKEIPGLKTEWESLANEIIEAKNAIYEANKEQANFYEDAKATELEYQYSKIADSMDILNSKMDLASDSEKVGLLKEQLKLIEQQKAKQEEMANNNKSEQKYFKDFLGKKGFKFDKDGEMTNAVGQLDKYKSDDEYESIKDAYDNYLELQQAIRDTDKESWELKVTEKELKDQIEEMIKEQEELNKQMGEMKNQAKIDSIISQNEALSNSLELVEAKMESAYGKDKAKYLEEQIRLLEEQRKKQKELADEYERQANVSKDGLGKDFGITFNDDGTIQNYADAMSKLTDIEDMEKLKDAVDKYLELQSDGLSDAQQEYENLGNEIQNAKDEILELANAMKEMKDEATTNQLQSQIDKIQNLIDMNEAKEGLNDSDKNQSLKDRLELYKKLQEETQKMLDYENSKKKDMVDTLNEYGFKINDDGTINDTANKLESLKNSMSESEFDFISETLEKYLETAFGSIPDLEKDLIESQKKMEDIQKAKLDITKKIEDEITKVYEKQKQDRIKKINEEKDARIKALNESKDAYNKFRDKEKYEDSHKEQLDKVNKLQSDIENAKRDTSLSGKKRLEDLMKQLADEQKNLENMVKDELDKNINDMFDDQIKDVETNSEEEIKKLEELWSSTNIANAVKEALSSGIFTDIDGNISALDDALMDFANNSEDYLGVMGDSLKKELCDNLEISLDYIKQMDNIYSKLSTPDLSNIKSNLKSYDYKDLNNPIGSYEQNISNKITFGDTKITVEGGANEGAIVNIEKVLKEQREGLISDIMKNIKI